MFLAVAITVFLLIYLANSQMTDLFQGYVTVQHMEMHRSMMTHMGSGGHRQAVIQGHLEGMIDGIIESNQKQLTSLHEEAVRLSRLIKDLKDLALTEVRQLSLEIKEVDVNQMVGRPCTC
ncbi:hypothetical protein SCACP_05280 [Sporomusa carbonis]